MTFKKPKTWDDDCIRVNTLCMRSKIPLADIEKYSRAKAGMDLAGMQAIHDKYPTPLASDDAPDAPNDEQKHAVQKASNTYKKLTRVLRYQMLKEEVLLNNNHSCYCCGIEFPPRSSFDIDYPGQNYPLIARCNFPIVKYIEVKKLHHLPDLLRDEKIFDPKNYLPLCDDCKPLSFHKRK